MTEHDVVVVGAGTAGCYAAAQAATAGIDVLVLERKTEAAAGEIACGDALKGASSFPDVIPKSQIEPAFTNTAVDHGRFEIPQADTTVQVPVDGEMAVVNRPLFGERLIEGTQAAGATIQYETVVNDVLQDDSGRVTGVQGVHDGSPETYEAQVVVDAGGALSTLQDRADLGNTTFDTNVSHRQFCSAYREIIELHEPVDWEDALVFKPTDRAAGYIWYFPRTPTEINAGIGFQMTEEPMHLAQTLKADIESREEFENPIVLDKRGAALPTRRVYDSAVAPGYCAVGDAAGHVNPTTGGGIAGAAYAGVYAADAIIDALESGEPTEAALWEYNERVMDHFGGRFGALDAYNIFTTAVDPDELRGLFASLPGEKVTESLYAGATDLGLATKAEIAIKSFGQWGLLYRLLRTKNIAEELLDVYEEYPSDPDGLPAWQERRDGVLEELFELTDAPKKY